MGMTWWISCMQVGWGSFGGKAGSRTLRLGKSLVTNEKLTLDNYHQCDGFGSMLQSCSCLNLLFNRAEH